MANGNGLTESWHESVPVWAKTLVFLIGSLGVPVMVMGYFMAQNAGIINGPALRNEAAIQRVETALASAVRTMNDNVMKRDNLQEKLLHVAVETCRNAAKTPNEQLRCDYWRGPVR